MIAGLGNPGPDYARTRHNVGFRVVEALAEWCRAEWKPVSRFQADVARTTLNGQPVILCRPVTYMNLSGEAVAPLARYYRVAAQDILVVADDANLPFGKVRLRPDGSAGGHHGLESIERQVGGRQYARLRVGIGRAHEGQRDIRNYVLGAFDEREEAVLGRLLAHCVKQIEVWLYRGAAEAMSLYNGMVELDPPDPEKKESSS